jgi:hypothetical protein
MPACGARRRATARLVGRYAAYMGARERESTPEDASAAAGRYTRRSSTSSRRPHEVSYSIHLEECAMNTIDTFASVIADRGMTVHVTPLCAESLGPAVVQKSPKSLVVQELNQGTGNYSFDWEVKGIRARHEDYHVS